MGRGGIFNVKRLMGKVCCRGYSFGNKTNIIRKFKIHYYKYDVNLLFEIVFIVRYKVIHIKILSLFF